MIEIWMKGTSRLRSPPLAQPIRLQVFRALVVAGPEGLRPGVLSELLSVAPTSLSFHLKELMHSALVSQRRESRKLICRAELHHMNSLLGYLTENCWQGEACLPAPPPVTAEGEPNHHDRVVDVMEEPVKFTLLTRDCAAYLVDWYSERKESAEQLLKRVNLRSI